MAEPLSGERYVMERSLRCPYVHCQSALGGASLEWRGPEFLGDFE